VANEVKYLRLIGRLTVDNELRLRLGYLTTRPADLVEDRQSELVALLIDSEGRTLLRFGVPLASYCDMVSFDPERLIHFSLPLPSGTASIIFLRDEFPIHEIQVNASEPNVSLQWDPGDQVRGTHDVTWQATHPGDGDLEFFLRYSADGGTTWQRASRRTREQYLTVDFDVLPGGEQCRLAVVATDGVNTAIDASRPFSVPIKPCRAFVLSPTDGETFASGDIIVLEGQGYYLEEAKPEFDSLRWRSDPSAIEARGPHAEVSAPQPGAYVLILEAGDADRTGTTSVSISVQPVESV
jgi:hypothetical protein